MSTCGASASYVEKEHKSINARAAGIGFNENPATESQITYEITREINVDKIVLKASPSEI